MADTSSTSSSATSSTVVPILLLLSGSSIVSTSAAPSLLNPNITAYIRFRDGAGNLSSIIDSNGKLIACYTPTWNASTGALQIGTHQLMEVTEEATVADGLNGTEPFFSGRKIEQEVGIYYSEILNGTYSLVQWNRITWDQV